MGDTGETPQQRGHISEQPRVSNCGYVLLCLPAGISTKAVGVVKALPGLMTF